MRFIYIVTYAVVLMAAIVWGLIAMTEYMPLTSRIILAIVGISALVQIMFNIQGYRLASNYVR